ncbi:MAG: tetratricopeptide repeat protein, partial [Acidimicrobiales bacterium]
MTGDLAERAELEEERDFLLRSLRDLEAERAAGDIDHADYHALRDDYTARAAVALTALGAPGGSGLVAAAVPGAVRSGSTAGASGSRRKPLLVGAGVVAFAIAAGAFMARSSGERLPGEPASGSITATGPSDQLARARLLIGRDKTLDAIRLYDTVLAKQPAQPEALTYRGWLVLLAGRQSANPALADKGLASIEQAIAADPAYPDAHFFRGLVLFQDRNDPSAAAAELRAFLASSPPAQYVPVAEDALR